MAANLSFVDIPQLPDDARAQLSAEVASLRSEIERLFGKGTREALGLIEALEDDVQEALLRGLESVHVLHRDGGSVRAWVATIARNLRVDRARALQREEARFSRDEGQLAVMSTPQRSPETLAMLRDACRRVSDALDRMDPTSKRAFLLFHFDGFTHAEVGALLGLTEAAAKMRCVRVHEKLVDEVGEHVMDVLNDLRCRLPPMFFENERAERHRVERRRRTYEATRHTATICALWVASMFVGFRLEMPLVRAGLAVPSVDVPFAAEPVTYDAPAVANAVVPRPHLAPPSRPAAAKLVPPTTVVPSQKTEDADSFDLPRDGDLYVIRTH